MDWKSGGRIICCASLLLDLAVVHADPVPSAADLFAPIPVRWGLRGDPLLWEALGHSLRSSAMPSSARQLRDLLERHFEQLCGQPLATAGQAPVPDLDRGGMSGGLVSGPFWRDTALPLLLQRHALWLGSRRLRRRRRIRTGFILLVAVAVLVASLMAFNERPVNPELPAERLPVEVE